MIIVFSPVTERNDAFKAHLAKPARLVAANHRDDGSGALNLTGDGAAF
ncbi:MULTISPECIES: hypothetical protein [unclassified Bradyrhizobium]|nr:MULTISPECIES: hypothetical protein [unclassified Bradyrhizobium]MBR1227258.1 hypothetical protein [Bradyrhizobium sp. AUGA SZCCT0176]MBR1280535.1 hypothetical protein [Bradyrhizobium sp. AUGA SZCCT0177]MBR1298686.1 hypothetical protein [Bradyrhizobium sp. AUGA SZCCT0042]